MIAVFDTNVLIAAIITEGMCSKLLHRARAGEFSLISCPFILEELRRILSKKFRLSYDEIASAMEPISEATSQIVEHNLKITDICRDTDDDNIIACAVAAKTDYLVTGDSDLLEIKSCQGVKIITPRDFEALFV
jgi:putative PIN family toxin of toxin-antitoxin system